MTMTIGTVGWAAAAAATSEGADAVGAKRELLESDLTTAPYPSMLAGLVRAATRDGFAIDATVMAAPDGVPPPWRVEVAVTEVACEDNKPGQPFALRIEGRVRLTRAGQTQVMYERGLASGTQLKLTTAEWRADGAAAAKASLEQSLRALARGLLDDLLRQPQDSRRASEQPL